MKRVRLLTIAALTMFAFGAVAAAVASAAAPSILILSGNVTELKAEGTGGASKLETVGGKVISGTGVTASIKGCLELEKKPLDTNLCHEGLITFTGTKQGKVACRSEKANGEKEKVETIAAKLDLHLDAEKSTSGTLQPLLVSLVLGIDGQELTILCSPAKEKVKGRIGCLLLEGLKNIATTETVEIKCVVEKGKQVTGTCEQTPLLCEELAKDPFLGNLGEGYEGAGMEIKVTGSFNKDVFIED